MRCMSLHARRRPHQPVLSFVSAVPVFCVFRVCLGWYALPFQVSPSQIFPTDKLALPSMDSEEKLTDDEHSMSDEYLHDAYGTEDEDNTESHPYFQDFTKKVRSPSK